MKNLQTQFYHDFQANFLHFYFLKYLTIRVAKMIINS